MWRWPKIKTRTLFFFGWFSVHDGWRFQNGALSRRDSNEASVDSFSVISRQMKQCARMPTSMRVYLLAEGEGRGIFTRNLPSKCVPPTAQRQKRPPLIAPTKLLLKRTIEFYLFWEGS